jgi:hypothetical protein
VTADEVTRELLDELGEKLAEARRLRDASKDFSQSAEECVTRMKQVLRQCDALEAEIRRRRFAA